MSVYVALILCEGSKEQNKIVIIVLPCCHCVGEWVIMFVDVSVCAGMGAYVVDGWMDLCGCWCVGVYGWLC